ncbi:MULTISPECIES: response regulator [unclassified Leptolyngbya]|nr:MULTISPECIES: response regulator [unclassified Leptolyngbya]
MDVTALETGNRDFENLKLQVMEMVKGEKRDILIVDDLPDNLRFLSTFLVSNGYSVRKATSGRMAQVAIAALVPDLILLDINLGDMSGYDLCQHLKKNPDTQAVPIIFLSAISDVTDKFKAFQMGGADYITKPFQLEEVLARVQTQLTISELQKNLEQQNLQLQAALDSLKRAQENLIQQEKMTTLKRVVAGVVHQVNNPLSFVACNVDPARQYFDHMATLLEIYERNTATPIPEVEDFKKQIDLPFMLNDTHKVLTSIKHGAQRIHRVTQALKNFTHLDEATIKTIDVNEDIESTLILLEHRLGNGKDGLNIDIQKCYGELPSINCYPEQIAQVLFNILSNAVDAIAEKWQSQSATFASPRITITTSVVPTDLSDHIVIRIHDNGIGITPDRQERIFEPFFTTKAAGQGLGLGLVTSRRIIEEQHHGQLTFHSSLKEGTEFTIQLPTLPAC